MGRRNFTDQKGQGEQEGAETESTAATVFYDRQKGNVDIYEKPVLINIQQSVFLIKYY